MLDTLKWSFIWTRKIVGCTLRHLLDLLAQYPWNPFHPSRARPGPGPHKKGAGTRAPPGGVRLFHQKSTFLSLSTVGPNAVRMWSPDAHIPRPVTNPKTRAGFPQTPPHNLSSEVFEPLRERGSALCRHPERERGRAENARSKDVPSWLTIRPKLTALWWN